jgi:hypothetical protein
MKFKTAVLAALLLIFASGFGPLPRASASPRGEGRQVQLSSLLRESLHSHWEAEVIDKLTEFRLNDEAWEKMLDPKTESGFRAANSYAKRFAAYAKRMGYGDLEDIESANNNDRTANRARIDALIRELKGRYSFTLILQSADCDETTWRLTLLYWATVGEILSEENENWRPRGEKAFITLIMSPSARDVSVEASRDGTRFTITAPTKYDVEEGDRRVRNAMLRAVR